MDLEMAQGMGKAGSVSSEGARMGTITYNTNGGEGQAPVPQNFEVGQAVTLADLVNPRALGKTDHTFDGWMDISTGALYSQGESARFDKSAGLYAKFTRVFEQVINIIPPD
jgi:hypothetical protein